MQSQIKSRFVKPLWRARYLHSCSLFYHFAFTFHSTLQDLRVSLPMRKSMRLYPPSVVATDVQFLTDGPSYGSSSRFYSSSTHCLFTISMRDTGCLACLLGCLRLGTVELRYASSRSGTYYHYLPLTRIFDSLLLSLSRMN